MSTDGGITFVWGSCQPNYSCDTNTDFQCDLGISSSSFGEIQNESACVERLFCKFQNFEKLSEVYMGFRLIFNSEF